MDAIEFNVTGTDKRYYFTTIVDIPKIFMMAKFIWYWIHVQVEGKADEKLVHIRTGSKRMGNR